MYLVSGLRRWGDSIGILYCEPVESLKIPGPIYTFLTSTPYVVPTIPKYPSTTPEYINGRRGPAKSSTLRRPRSHKLYQLLEHSKESC